MSKRQQAGYLRHLLRFFTGIIALLLIAAVAVSMFRIPLDLSSYKSLVESSVGKALGREVRIDGGIVVTTSLWPYFEIEGLNIANPGGLAEGNLATMDLARVSVGLLPLLQREIRIGEFRVSGLTLDLVRDKTGTRPIVTLDLSAQKIQMQDFDTGDWAAEDPVVEPVPQGDTDAVDPAW